MRTNPKASVQRPLTHEGAPAALHMTPEQQLRRSVLSCMLWESEHYEDGVDIAQRISHVASLVPATVLANLAVEARSRFNLRHVPLLLLVFLIQQARGMSIVADTIEATIQRPDELGELLALYWKINGETAPLAAQLKKGLARAFAKFDSYALGRYNTDHVIKLRDVLFLVHGKPQDSTGAVGVAEAIVKDNYRRGATHRHVDSVYTKLVAGTLAVPDTWEKALSAATTREAKCAEWTRLLTEGKLGYMALLRNLRNMAQVAVDPDLVKQAIVARGKGAGRVLPFRFITAVRHAPQFSDALDTALQANMAEMPRLPGRTVVLVDVSSSMNSKVSGKSEISRMDAACALAAIIPAESLRVFSFSDVLVECPGYRGLAGIEAIKSSQRHNGTALIDAVSEVNARVVYDRIIVITDEQSHPSGGTRAGYFARVSRASLEDPKRGSVGYMINVASAQFGVGYGPWCHIDGFAEATLRFISEIEAAE